MIFEARLKFFFAAVGLSVLSIQLTVGTNFKVLFSEGGRTEVQIWHGFLDRK
jgi:hypothetical protein